MIKLRLILIRRITHAPFYCDEAEGVRGLYNLKPEDHLVYCWRYREDPLAKIGVSRVDCLYGRISQAQTINYRNVELLGVQPCKSRKDAMAVRRMLLEVRLKRYRSNREWVFLDKEAWEWLSEDCIRDIPTNFFRRLEVNPESHQERLETRVLEILARRPRLTARQIGRNISWADSSEVNTVISRLVKLKKVLVENVPYTLRYSLRGVYDDSRHCKSLEK